MVRLLSSLQRRLFEARGGRTLQLVFRGLLRVVLFPGVPWLVLLCILYSIAELVFSAWYFPIFFVWKPAFPSSWRFLFLSLFVVPAFAFLQLVWLSLRHWVHPRWWQRRHSPRSGPWQSYFLLPRSEPNSEERDSELSGARVDEDYDAADVEGDLGSPRLFSHLQRQPRPLFSFPSAEFIFPLVLFWTSVWLGLHYQHAGDLRYLSQIQNAIANPVRSGYANNETIFIAAMFYNNEKVIPYWSDSLVKAIHYLGPDNVFVSIVESESEDRSSALLQQLDDQLDSLGVSRRILMQDKTVTKPDDMSGNNRIDFLAALRNRAMEPLVENGGYDKVIFSNDIFIEPETIVELVHTADGEYDMACGMDYGHFGLYDMWVLRDKAGRLGSGIWPYFFDVTDYEAMQTESPVPVFTCWNGIVIFKADPVLPIHLRSNRTLSTDPLPFAIPRTHPAASDASLRGPSPALTPPTRFRASAPEECFSSESFLLPYDFRRLFGMQRILVNPRVVVGYDWRFYVYFKWFMRHPVLKWWIEKVYDGAWMQKDVLVVGDEKRVWQWDGGDCHPWW